MPAASSALSRIGPMWKRWRGSWPKTGWPNRVNYFSGCTPTISPGVPWWGGGGGRPPPGAGEHPGARGGEPVPLGGELGYYSGEDMPEKTSMMTYADVFVTVYSTMVVEAAIHDRPIVSLCLDSP